jgi:hypothetical protein
MQKHDTAYCISSYKRYSYWPATLTTFTYSHYNQARKTDTDAAEGEGSERGGEREIKREKERRY